MFERDGGADAMSAPANDTMISGGVLFQTVRLRCRVLASKKQDTLIVTVPGVPDTITPPSFYVDPLVVETSQPVTTEGDVGGTLQVLLLEERSDDTIVVEVLGEPVSYGPKLLIGRNLLA
jgi:hypothetical protein